MVLSKDCIDGCLLRIANTEIKLLVSFLIVIVVFIIFRKESSKSFQLSSSCFSGSILQLINSCAEETNDENFEIFARMFQLSAF